ncbi:MAG: PLP-dependent aminotransferase family protein [Candidatus Rokuibacteriota bacterium]|nr:MAG: PLP-dependent aminotransferase family protein [Candidatus Rokubacteria bacterium]
MLLLNLRGADGPLYRRVYHALKSTIRAGRLAPDARLPSTRELAADLRVSRNTVMLAYEQLLAEGYVVTRDRATTSVASALPAPAKPVSFRPQPAPPAALSAYARRLMRGLGPVPGRPRPRLRYDFRYGEPSIDEFPREIWRRLLAARTRRPARDAFGYASPAGYAPLRAALADYLKRARGVVCEPDQIVITNGSQQGFDLAARVLLDPGDVAVVEEPHYPGVTIPFEAAGARLARVAVDGDGLQTRRLPPRARVAYVTPCHQFPTGVIMPLERRLALLAWAARAGAWVIEDDYVSEFRYEGHPLEALQSLDRESRVIYVGTFSKTLFPALRVAYLVLPPALVPPFIAAKWATDRFSATLAQEVLAEFITTGQFERYLRRAGNRNAARRGALIGALRQHFGDRVEIAGENTGVHLVVWLNDVRPRDLAALIARARELGVGLYSVAPFHASQPPRAGLLFGYASLTEADIRAGIRRMAEAAVTAGYR